MADQLDHLLLELGGQRYRPRTVRGNIPGEHQVARRLLQNGFFTIVGTIFE